MDSIATIGTTGRVLSVNVSTGGIPKLPVAEAWVDRLGLAGDGHNDRTVHGGPHRAVCMFSIEAIERLQADGHPVEAGSVGENLTTSGIDWSLLPIGTRARVGDRLLLEVASAAAPCATQRPNFSDGRFSRISIDLFPSDARMYARVLEPGPVRPGDEIELLPVPADSRAVDETILDRLDWIAAKSSLAEWRAVNELGGDIDIVDDGELAMAAVRDDADSGYNHAYGLARLPNLVPDAKRFYDRFELSGCLITDGAPWPGAEPSAVMDVLAADPAEVAEAAGPAGLRVERLTTDFDGWLAVRRAVDATHARELDARSELAARLAGSPHIVMLLATLGEAAVGIAWMYFGHRTAWLRGGAVVPSARGRGVHRALVSARGQIAAEKGCDLIGAWAEQDTASSRNLAALGFRRVGARGHYRYQPVRTAQLTTSPGQSPAA